MMTRIILKQQNLILLMIKKILYLLPFIFPVFLHAQRPTFGVNSSNNYTSIHNYNGVTSTGAYNLWFQYTGTNLNIPNWRVSVRLKQPILSSEGNLQIPPDKVSLIATHTQGQAQPSGIPSISQIGIPLSVPLSAYTEVFLVPMSNAPLYNVSQWSSYYNLQIFFNLEIAGGAYLEALQGGNTQKRYTMVLEFKAYGANNEVIGVEERTYTIDIFKLSGTAPVTKQYSIVVSGNSKNALVELSKISDYVQGSSVLYTNGLNVTTNTDYQLNLRSLGSHFNSINSVATLPLDVIRVELIPAQSGTSTVIPILLSGTSQKISEGTSTNNAQRSFHIKYSTAPGDNRLINAKMEQYTTILEFQIIPR